MVLPLAVESVRGKPDYQWLGRFFRGQSGAGERAAGRKGNSVEDSMRVPNSLSLNEGPGIAAPSTRYTR